MGTPSGHRASFYYRLSVGVVCTCAVLFLFIYPEVVGWRYEPKWTAVFIYVVMALLARYFKFQAPEGNVTLTMDTPVYLAAVVSLGDLMGGLSSYVASLLMMIIELKPKLTGVRSKDRAMALQEATVRLVFAPGICAATLIALSAGFRAAGLYGGGWQLPVFTVALGISFIVVQYSLAGFSHVLRGVDRRRFFRVTLLPGMQVEFALVPLAILMVLVYDEADLMPFAMLVAVFVFNAAVLRRQARTGARLARQVRELGALNRLGQTICATLERPELVAQIAHETLGIFRSADAFLLQWTDATGKKHLDVYGKDGATPATFPYHEAIATIEGHSEDTEPRPVSNEDGIWILAPVMTELGRVGTLALWRDHGASYADSDARSLGGIAQQAAVALENARLYELATVDSLTGLYLRRYFNERLEQEVERSRRQGVDCTLCCIDVDFLKTINDTWGHAAGDAALKHVAQVMRQQTRMVDVPARLGGDEFAIILSHTDLDSAVIVGERIRERIAGRPAMVDGRELRVTVSLGLAGLDGDRLQTVQDLNQAADEALYAAKMAQNRNTVVAWEPGLATKGDAKRS